MYDNIIRTERIPRKSGGPRAVYVMKCLNTECNNEIRVRKSEYKNHSKKCSSCSHKKKQFESLYNGIMNDWRGFNNTLTYKQFLKFTKINKCYYCNDHINWLPYSNDNGKYLSRAYYLDRKNNKNGYSFNNCVVCCTFCNKMKKGVNYNDFKLWIKKVSNTLCKITQ